MFRAAKLTVNNVEFCNVTICIKNMDLINDVYKTIIENELVRRKLLYKNFQLFYKYIDVTCPIVVTNFLNYEPFDQMLMILDK